MRRLALIITLVLVTLSLTPQALLAASLSVTAVVPADATDFSAILSASPITTLGPQATITYTLAYSSTLTTDTPITLEANWSRGTIEENGAQVDVASYVEGSATNAYGATSPVIDLINQKITWDISSFPGNLPDQKVSFKLKTNSITADNKINFTVTGHLKGPDLITPDSIVTTSYSNYPTTTPTPTPNLTPTPSAGGSPTPSLTLIPTKTSTPPAPTTASITIRTIGENNATIAVLLNKASPISLSYGTDVSRLTSIVTDPKSSREHVIHLEGLSKTTSYFFKVTYGQKISSIYTFITALQGNVPSPILSSLVVTSDNTLLNTTLQQQATGEPPQDKIILPIEATYDFKITIPDSQNLKRVQAVLRNSQTLAIESGSDYKEQLVDLVEISPNIFTGRLKTPTVIGNYNLFLRLLDKRGAIAEQKISSFRVVRPFIIHTASGKPVEAARVALYYYDRTSKSYVFLSNQSTGITNPSFSDRNGKVPIILPQGRYRAEIRLLGFSEQKVEFSIGTKDHDGYPDVTLQEQPFSVIGAIRYFGTTLKDLVYTKTEDYVLDVSASRRVLDLVSFLSLASFLILLVASFMTKAQLSLRMLPRHLLYLYQRILRRSKPNHSLTGKVLNSIDEKPLQGVTVYAIDHSTEKIVSHAITNREGNFILTNLMESSYTLSFVKNGFRPFVLQAVSPELNSNLLKIALTSKEYHRTIPHFLMYLLLFILEKGFVGIILVSFFFCLIIEVSLGWHEVIPYLILASFNVITWMLHERYEKVGLI